MGILKGKINLSLVKARSYLFASLPYYISNPVNLIKLKKIDRPISMFFKELIQV